MEAIKEVKILHYVIIIILGLQLSFTFKKLNSIEDKIEAITITTASKDVYLIETDSSGDTLWKK